MGLELNDVKSVQNSIPSQFVLHQNYPNPFNPVTMIRFEIASDVKGQTSDVQLVVYDVIGKQILELVNERLSPGTYEFEFDGKNLPSGVYFCKLNAGDFVAVRKMMLIK